MSNLPPGWTEDTIKEMCGTRYSNRHYKDKSSWGFMHDDLVALLDRAFQEGKKAMYDEITKVDWSK